MEITLVNATGLGDRDRAYLKGGDVARRGPIHVVHDPSNKQFPPTEPFRHRRCASLSSPRSVAMSGSVNEESRPSSATVLRGRCEHASLRASPEGGPATWNLRGGAQPPRQPSSSASTRRGPGTKPGCGLGTCSLVASRTSCPDTAAPRAANADGSAMSDPPSARRRQPVLPPGEAIVSPARLANRDGAGYGSQPQPAAISPLVGSVRSAEHKVGPARWPPAPAGPAVTAAVPALRALMPLRKIPPAWAPSGDAKPPDRS